MKKTDPQQNALMQAYNNLRETRRQAAVDTSLLDYTIRPGHDGLKRQAIARLDDEQEAVAAAAIPHRLVGLFPTVESDPDMIQKVAAFVADEGGIQLDCGEWLEKTAKRVEATFQPGREHEFGVIQFQTFREAYYELIESDRARVGFREMEHTGSSITPDRACLLDYLAIKLRSACDDQWLKVALRGQLKRELIAPDRFDGERRIPVVVTGHLPAYGVSAARNLFVRSVDRLIPADQKLDSASIAPLFKPDTNKENN